MPTDDDFENMVYNNWHGWGLVLRDGNNRLEIMRDNPVENNPEELYDLIDKHRDLERFLHVRHATAGDVEMHNIHPFEVISTNKGQLLFMHNGTITECDPTHITDKNHIAVKEGWSDTRYYQESVLTPIVEGLKDPLDIWNPSFRKIMTRFWPSGNRGLLITNKGACTLGTWVNRKDVKGNDYVAANDTYFSAVIRGPEFDRREAAKKAAMAAAREEREARGGTNVVPFEDGKRYIRSDHFTKVYGTTQFFNNIRENPEIYNQENLTKLAHCTAAELALLIEALGEDLVPFMMYVTEALSNLAKERDEYEDKLVRATKFIATLRKLEPSLPASIDEANAEVLLKESAEKNVRKG